MKSSHFNFGECDCCGKNNRVLFFYRGTALAPDAWRCGECGGYDAETVANELFDEINRLIQKAGSGGQWDYIRAIESAFAEIRESA